MRTEISAVVTPDDLIGYVSGKNPNIRSSRGEDGSVSVESRQFKFKFVPKNVKWSVRIEATDDPDDSDEEVTAEPVKFIAKFLGTGVPGGEHFDKMSSTPSGTAELLRRLAAEVAAFRIGPRRLSSVLRRAAVRPQAGLLNRVVEAVCRTAAGQGNSIAEVKKLQEEMKKKGWKVEEGETDAGVPQLKVDVSGIYEATVRPDSIPYEYELQTIGTPDLDEKGTTEDPIETIRKYARRSDVNAAVERHEAETGRTEHAPSSGGFKPAKGIKPGMEGTEKTMPAEAEKPEPEFRNDKTVPTKKK